MKAPSQRQLRVGELVRHALSEILQRGDVADPVLARTFVTVSEVRMSPDLKNATVYLMPLGGEGLDEVLAALETHRKHLRHEVARRVKLRFTPELRFEADATFDESDRITTLLHTPQVRRDLDRDEPDDDA